MSLVLLFSSYLELPAPQLQLCQLADQLQEGGLAGAAEPPLPVHAVWMLMLFGCSYRASVWIGKTEFARNTSEKMTTTKTPLGFLLFPFYLITLATLNTVSLAILGILLC